MIDISQVGRCPSCETAKCPTPKHKTLYPEQGCPQWSTAESRKRKLVPVIKVIPLKD